MSDVLNSFGVQADALVPQRNATRKRVDENVAHIDGDFMCYQIAADTRDELDGIRPLRTLEYKQAQIEDKALELMERAGCGRFVLHVTPGASTKGGRAAQAVQKEYQAARLGKEKPGHLDAIRGSMGIGKFRFGEGMVHLDQEADDGLAQAGSHAPGKNIILSADKDLRMAPGMHMDLNTDEMIWVEPGDFGTIWIDDTKSSKKCVGYGPKFFWAQCLMGDTVDNIQGLPAMSGWDVQRLKDPELHGQNVRIMGLPDMQKSVTDRIQAAWNKTKPCGQVGAYNALADVKSNKEAFEVVRDLFTNVATKSGYQFKHWQTSADVTPTQALLGDMRCLWMRLSKDPDDVVAWLKRSV